MTHWLSYCSTVNTFAGNILKCHFLGVWFDPHSSEFETVRPITFEGRFAINLRIFSLNLLNLCDVLTVLTFLSFLLLNYSVGINRKLEESSFKDRTMLYKDNRELSSLQIWLKILILYTRLAENPQRVFYNKLSSAASF